MLKLIRNIYDIDAYVIISEYLSTFALVVSLL